MSTISFDEVVLLPLFGQHIQFRISIIHQRVVAKCLAPRSKVILSAKVNTTPVSIHLCLLLSAHYGQTLLLSQNCLSPSSFLPSFFKPFVHPVISLLPFSSFFLPSLEFLLAFFITLLMLPLLTLP